MEKQRKHFAAADKVKLLRRRLVGMGHVKTIVAALAAGLASIAVHASVEVIAATTGGLPGYLAPLSRESLPRYMMTFAIQAVVLVVGYLIVGGRLPGRSAMRRGVVFGSLVFLFGACLPLAPMVLVFREALPPGLALEAVVGGALLSFAEGVAFVVTWESVTKRMQELVQ